ncbi:hypothetical protein SG26_20180 (plasmid) [Haloarcula sp. CBA1115]|uniref:hypothetical protein n=1 Tax=unclassified Haloarcula TaxID=2624677 RepID=UPI0005955603|nr:MULTISPECIES: hypothetical protein [unclassified Haloarcula]AJF28064.1 hypothetical protein SG26_20180 [Haloarcula sp. CBA1115]
MCCPDCHRPQSASACVDKRYHIDGQAFDPIPWGEGSQSLTYERQTLESGEPTAVIDPERWRDRSCPACGVEQGELHHQMCDYEECPACGEQLLLCSCLVEIEINETSSITGRFKKLLARLL